MCFVELLRNDLSKIEKTKAKVSFKLKLLEVYFDILHSN
jgi:hypothetical protein